ncbi:PAS/PAC sensor hybrid histidine kinase [Fibrisoma limi BUZ 3]|uniref:histidine kinase n=1 Tax=Fibrisoma limi BUZ 3 TaxID=1185876 RepID=I2GJK7_9BACT|nr:ATP-binding protein [Fibrisoma limi]CCH54082.1 PAS/PAC sensor hybrid histidine kinase [Fibrisoma limi BUZ 3]
MNNPQQSDWFHGDSSQPDNLSASEKYLMLVNHMQQGFCIIEVLFDETGQPLDYRFLEVNPVFEQQTGLVDPVGKTMRELQPAHEQHWFDTYAQVVKTGQPIHFENQAAHLAGGVWYEVFAFPFGPATNHQVAILFDDITARKKAEAALRASQKQQTYLLKLADTLRMYADQPNMPTIACQLLAQELGAIRVNYAEVKTNTYVVEHEYHSAGLSSMIGQYAISSFRPNEQTAFKAGRTVVISDIEAEANVTDEQVAAYADLNVRAFISVPLLRHGKLVVVLSAIREQPGPWQPEEISLVEETAERTWTAHERARAEETLRASEQKYRTLFDSIDEGFHISELIYDQAGQPVDYRFLEVNPVFEWQTGLQNTVGRLSSEIAPNVESYWLQAYHQVVQTGQPIRIENYNQATDRWYTAYTSRVGGADNRQFVVVFDDITERKQAQEALRHSEEQFRMLVTASSDIVYRMNPDWTQLHRLIGTTFPADIQDSNATWLQTYIPAEDQPQIQQLIQEAIRTRTPFELEHRIMRADGTIGWMFSRAIPMLDEQGTIQSWLGASSDITARKQAEEVLQESNRRKDEFLAMLGHELRNPLATVSNLLLVLELTDGTDENLSYPKAVRLMSREVRYMTRMVDDLLDVGRIRYGLIQLHKQPIDLVTLVRQTVEVAQPLYEQQQRQLSLALPPYSLVMQGDETRLKQVLMNLLTNGLKYTQPAGHVWVSLELADNSALSKQALLRMKDDGIGIAADRQEAIFDIFVQGETTLDRPQGGLGLGLAVVKQLVALHDGSIEVRSEGPGQGSEFLIRLPLTLEVSGSVTTGPSISSSAKSKGRVLVVDDNQTLADMTARLVELSGYEAQTSYSGADALLVAQQWRPDMMLLDLGMPHMDGFEVKRRLTEQPWGNTISVIALTGYGQEPLKAQTDQAGFAAYLLKPLNLLRLRELLRAIMPPGNSDS